MGEFNWIETVKDIKDCNEFQRESQIDLLQVEPSDKYKYDDFIYAYNFEKEHNKPFVVSGQILTKMIMPYIYSNLSDELKSYKDDIVINCYLDLVQNAIPKLDMEKIANADYPANMLCGYCKLYCKHVIADTVRGNVPIAYYNKGYRKESVFSDVKIIQSRKIEYDEEKQTNAFLDNRHYYTSNTELHSVEDDIRKKQLIAGIYAVKYKVSFKKSMSKKKIDINALLNDYDKLSQESKKTVIEYAIEVTKEKKGLNIADETHAANIRYVQKQYCPDKVAGIGKTISRNEINTFLNKFILNLNEKQLDDFIQRYRVYDKIVDVLDKFDISAVKDSPFDMDFKEADSMWDRLVTNHIQIDYSKNKDEEDYER